MNQSQTILLTQELKTRLIEKGVDNLWHPGSVRLPVDCNFESPCSTKWMEIHHSLAIGAFSYAVSGYFFACQIGRYCSIGENVQAGRGDHPLDWLSTSPFQYMDRREVFSSEGFDFDGGYSWKGYRKPNPLPHRCPNHVKPIEIGNDVWIGQGAYLKPGIIIGNGAVIGANAVVTRDVPAYAVVVGNPGRTKKMRFNEKTIERLEAIAWWSYAIWDISGIFFDQIDQALDFIEEKKTLGIIRPYETEYLYLYELSQSLSNPLPHQIKSRE